MLFCFINVSPKLVTRMKDLARLRSSVKESVELALNQQIQMEMVSSSKYLAMAGWCDRNGLDHSAGFFYNQSEEERKHAMKFFHYLCDQGATAYSPEVPAVSQEFDSLRSVFEGALDQEIAVTDSINRIIGICRRESDYATEELLKWYRERANGRRIHCSSLPRTNRPDPIRSNLLPGQKTRQRYLRRQSIRIDN